MLWCCEAVDPVSILSLQARTRTLPYIVRLLLLLLQVVGMRGGDHCAWPESTTFY